jgi:hypothetical protein
MAKARKAWRTPKVTRLDGKNAPQNSLGPSSEAINFASVVS